MNIRDMSLEQKIGQLFVAGFPGKKPGDEFLQLVREDKVGNVILFSHNIESREQLADLNRRLRNLIREQTGSFPLIAVDEEGGVVSRLPSGMAVMPSAMAQGALGDEELVCRGAQITGEELLSLGINFNLAPVLDINSNADNPVIGVRSFGDDKETVCRFGAAAVRGYQKAGILCSGKHFPGHGDTMTDSHLELPSVERTLTELEKREMAPFAHLIREKLPAITIAHIRVPALEPENIPCTLSKRVITGYLRGRLGFDGLIISDCMEMNAIKEYYGISESVVKALHAGIDLIFISHTAAAVREAVTAVKKAVLSGELSVERLDDAVSRIMTVKKKYAGNRVIDPVAAGTEEQLRFAGEFLQRTIMPVNFAGEPVREKFPLGKKPLFAGALPSRITLAASGIEGEWNFAQLMQQKFGGEALSFSLNPSVTELQRIVKAARNSSAVVLGTLNAHTDKKQQQLIKELLAVTGDKMALVALRNPYDLRLVGENIFRLALYEYSVRTVDIAARFFSK